MNDTLLARANAVKKAVEKGRDNFIATKREFEVNQKLLKDTLSEVEAKFGLSSYEELQVAVKDLATKISGDLEKIEALLKEANIPLS